MIIYKWILMTSLLALAQEVSATTHMKFMTNYCSDTVQVLDSIVIVLLPPPHLKSDRVLDTIQCSLDLRAPEGHGLHVHFLHVSITPDSLHSDRLHLYELNSMNKRKMLTPDQGLYGMLDRSMLSSDYNGATIKDYTTWEQRIRFDYLGKPTQMHSGFRVLVTAVSKPNLDNNCPSGMASCSVLPVCISTALVCDGYPNCGHQDLSDEKGCDPDYLVTNLMHKYSLVYDIVVVTCIPALLFIIIVCLMVCYGWRHTKKMYPRKEAPPVSYIPDEERVQIEDSYAPPSYNDAIQDKPPAYYNLDAMEQAGTVVLESDDGHSKHKATAGRGRRHRNARDIIRQSMKSSNSSLDSVQSHEFHRVHTKNTRPIIFQPYDSSDDEETKNRHRKKGGKSKSKGKRRVDDLCPNTTHNQVTELGNPNTSSQSATPLLAQSFSTVDSPTVPYVKSAATSSSSVPHSSPSPPPPLGMKLSPSIESEGHVDMQGARTNNQHSSSSSTSDVAVLPVTNGCSRDKATHAEDIRHSDSSGVEADRKSETESESSCPTNNNSITESCSSLSENKKTPFLKIRKTEDDEINKNVDFQNVDDDPDNHNGGKGDNKGKLADDDVNNDEEDAGIYSVNNTIEDVYNDLRSKETIPSRGSTTIV